MQSRMIRLCCLLMLLSSVSAFAISVNVSTPANNSTVTSPVTIRASATPSSGDVITGWHIYVDGNDSYSAGGVTGIDTSLSIPNGTHTVVVRAWDSSGADADQTLTLNVTGQGVTVDVSTPTNGATVFSPVDFQARAVSANPITGWHIYVDGNDSFSAGATTAISASVPMNPGTHTVVVRAWDSTGAFGDQTLDLNVQQANIAVTVSSPANSATVSSPATIQASATSNTTITGWHIYVDSVDVFTAGQTDSIAPSLSMSPGTHSLVVRAWDASGGYASQSLTLNVVQGVQVSLAAPANGTTVNSPVPVQASAKSGNPITGWHIYVDSVDSFSAGATNSISTSLPIANGSHTLVIRAWDSTGAFGDQTVTVNVVSSGVSVAVTTPQNNATVNSPVGVQASARSTNAITGWHIYVDGNDVFAQSNVSSISTAINMTAGAHTMVVRAWDSTGAFGDQTLNLTVNGGGGGGGGGCTGTTNCYSNLDDINPWDICGSGCGNTGGSGSQPVTSQNVVSSPSEDGSAHQFSIGGGSSQPFTNAYWFINRTPSSNPPSPSGVVTTQSYSFDLLIPSGEQNAPQAIEWETHQQFNGVVYNTGWQANYADSGDPTKMRMRTFQWNTSPQQPNTPNLGWHDTGILIPRFSPDTFHHVQVDEHVSGSTIFFDDIIVDGIKYTPTNTSGQSHQAINAGSGFGDKFNNAFQLDMNGSATPFEVFIDNMNLIHNP